MKIRMTGIPYTPNVAHNIESWHAIVKCFEENGQEVSQIRLIGCIKDHPTPTTNKAKNAELHIRWHIDKMHTLEEVE